MKSSTDRRERSWCPRFTTAGGPLVSVAKPTLWKSHRHWKTLEKKAKREAGTFRRATPEEGTWPPWESQRHWETIGK